MTTLPPDAPPPTTSAEGLDTPLRRFLRTETGSAAVLLAATLAALLWANLDASSYQRLWHTTLAIRIGGFSISQDLQQWVNAGLMTFFFFVIGLEARREFDVGDLRERHRVALPLLAGIAGMVLPILVYLGINAGRDSAIGWGAAMSTDTAFALGLLAIVGKGLPDRLRAFLLTVVVIDDVVALLVIAFAYSGDVSITPLLVAAALFAVVLAVRAARVRVGLVYFALGLAIWLALYGSGVEPVIVGLAMGLLAYAYPAAREDLELASDRFRQFREQPTGALARGAAQSAAFALSPNERLLDRYHWWTSYLVVPLFALANIGLVVTGELLARAVRSPIALGIVAAYLIGKPLGVLAASWLTTRLSRGRLLPPVGWGAVLGAGSIAGIGFTVSLFIASLAFDGTQLDEAKIGVLGSLVTASLASLVIFRVIALLPKRRRIRALLGASQSPVDLAVPVDTDRDHIRGPLDAPITLVEYGDFQCPFCGRAEPVLRELLADFGDLRYVWRHLPLRDVHPYAQLAAEASEAAALQGAFWPMHDVLIASQVALHTETLVGYAQQLGLDTDRFERDLRRHSGNAQVAQDVEGADLSRVPGTPTFFVNGRRHQGAYDLATLSQEVRAARARVALAEAA
jgi:Na+/H+ antiporter NhaA